MEEATYSPLSREDCIATFVASPDRVLNCPCLSSHLILQVGS